jgi:hypothetical protein
LPMIRGPFHIARGKGSPRPSREWRPLRPDPRRAPVPSPRWPPRSAPSRGEPTPFRRERQRRWDRGRGHAKAVRPPASGRLRGSALALIATVVVRGGADPEGSGRANWRRSMPSLAGACWLSPGGPRRCSGPTVAAWAQVTRGSTAGLSSSHWSRTRRGMGAIGSPAATR